MIILLSTAVLSEKQSILDATQMTRNAPPLSTANTSARIMCGRWPDLFPCNASNPAVDYMSRCPFPGQRGSEIELKLSHAMRPCRGVSSSSPGVQPAVSNLLEYACPFLSMDIMSRRIVWNCREMLAIEVGFLVHAQNKTREEAARVIRARFEGLDSTNRTLLLQKIRNAVNIHPTGKQTAFRKEAFDHNTHSGVLSNLLNISGSSGTWTP